MNAERVTARVSRNPLPVTRYLFIILLFTLTFYLSYGTPRTQYQSPDFLSKLTIPAVMNSWTSSDISSEFQTGDQRYFFHQQDIRPPIRE